MICRLDHRAGSTSVSPGLGRSCLDRSESQWDGAEEQGSVVC